MGEEKILAYSENRQELFYRTPKKRKHTKQREAHAHPTLERYGTSPFNTPTIKHVQNGFTTRFAEMGMSK
jgi:hypothetical protein